MPYITDSDGNLNVFDVNRNDGEPWLNAYYGNPDNVFDSDYRFVFVLPRNYLCFSLLNAESFLFLYILSNRQVVSQCFADIQTKLYISFLP